MADSIFVNGAWIERDFLEENVAEARSCDWEFDRVPDSSNHHHCLVCGAALRSGEVVYRADNRWLGQYCYNRFIERSDEYDE